MAQNSNFNPSLRLQRSDCARVAGDRCDSAVKIQEANELIDKVRNTLREIKRCIGPENENQDEHPSPVTPTITVKAVSSNKSASPLEANEQKKLKPTNKTTNLIRSKSKSPVRKTVENRASSPVKLNKLTRSIEVQVENDLIPTFSGDIDIDSILNELPERDASILEQPPKSAIEPLHPKVVNAVTGDNKDKKKQDIGEDKKKLPQKTKISQEAKIKPKRIEDVATKPKSPPSSKSRSNSLPSSKSNRASSATRSDDSPPKLKSLSKSRSDYSPPSSSTRSKLKNKSKSSQESDSEEKPKQNLDNQDETSTKKSKSSNLTVQMMPKIIVPKTLVLQKILQVNIKPTDSKKIEPISGLNNNHYEEIIANLEPNQNKELVKEHNFETISNSTNSNLDDILNKAGLSPKKSYSLSDLSRIYGWDQMKKVFPLDDPLASSPIIELLDSEKDRRSIALQSYQVITTPVGQQPSDASSLPKSLQRTSRENDQNPKNDKSKEKNRNKDRGYGWHPKSTLSCSYPNVDHISFETIQDQEMSSIETIPGVTKTDNNNIKRTSIPTKVELNETEIGGKDLDGVNIETRKENKSSQTNVPNRNDLHESNWLRNDTVPKFGSQPDLDEWQKIKSNPSFSKLRDHGNPVRTKDELRARNHSIIESVNDAIKDRARPTIRLSDFRDKTVKDNDQTPTHRATSPNKNSDELERTKTVPGNAQTPTSSSTNRGSSSKNRSNWTNTSNPFLLGEDSDKTSHTISSNVPSITIEFPEGLVTKPLSVASDKRDELLLCECIPPIKTVPKTLISQTTNTDTVEEAPNCQSCTSNKNLPPIISINDTLYTRSNPSKLDQTQIASIPELIKTQYICSNRNVCKAVCPSIDEPCVVIDQALDKRVGDVNDNSKRGFISDQSADVDPGCFVPRRGKSSTRHLIKSDSPKLRRNRSESRCKTMQKPRLFNDFDQTTPPDSPKINPIKLDANNGNKPCCECPKVKKDQLQNPPAPPKQRIACPNLGEKDSRCVLEDGTNCQCACHCKDKTLPPPPPPPLELIPPKEILAPPPIKKEPSLQVIFKEPKCDATQTSITQKILSSSSENCCSSCCKKKKPKLKKDTKCASEESLIDLENSSSSGCCTCFSTKKKKFPKKRRVLITKIDDDYKSDDKGVCTSFKSITSDEKEIVSCESELICKPGNRFDKLTPPTPGCQNTTCYQRYKAKGYCDFDSTPSEFSVSEGEMRSRVCKCSVSLGEIHICGGGRSRRYRRRNTNYKTNPEGLMLNEFGDRSLEILRERVKYDNWVTFYVNRNIGVEKKKKKKKKKRK